jgi:hypothetical protein
VNYGVHVGSSLAYHQVCVPNVVTLYDIAISLVTTASPVCSFLLNTMQITQNNFAVAVTTGLAASLSKFL